MSGRASEEEKDDSRVEVLAGAARSVDEPRTWGGAGGGRERWERTKKERTRVAGIPRRKDPIWTSLFMERLTGIEPVSPRHGGVFYR